MNIYTNHANFVFGFHGCDKTVASEILNSSTKHLKISKNDYDWLGSGVYFWLNDPVRALEWATESMKRPATNIKEPAVIGAIIDLGNCLNLSERESVDTLKRGYKLLRESVDIKDLKNFASDKGGINLLRPLDCAVINYTCELLLRSEEPFFVDTVMGFFKEGEAIYSGTDIHEKTHSQICVRNKNNILGYFLPRLNNMK